MCTKSNACLCSLQARLFSNLYFAYTYNFKVNYVFIFGLLWWLSGKECACNAGDLGSIPGSGRSPGEENSNPPQYTLLGNHMERGAWWAIVHGVARVGHDLASQQ